MCDLRKIFNYLLIYILWNGYAPHDGTQKMILNLKIWKFENICVFTIPFAKNIKFQNEKYKNVVMHIYKKCDNVQMRKFENRKLRKFFKQFEKI